MAGISPWPGKKDAANVKRPVNLLVKHLVLWVIKLAKERRIKK